MDYRQKLKELREDHDLSQRQIAEHLCTSQQLINRYENMQTEMTVSRFKQLCEFYKVSADYILELPQSFSKPR